jgi:hypothetical protein
LFATRIVASRPGGALAQRGQQRLGQPDGRLEVELHVSLDVRPPAVSERRPPGGAGVVDEQVERAVMLAADHTGDRLRRLRVRQVHGYDGRATERIRERPQTFLAPCDQHQLRPGLARQPSRSRFADAAGGAGYERYKSVGHCRREAYPWTFGRRYETIAADCRTAGLGQRPLSPIGNGRCGTAVCACC